MELFVIKRYTGEDSDEKNISNEDELKKNFFKKIKERERLRESNTFSDYIIPEKKKKREFNKDESEISLGYDTLVTIDNNLEKKPCSKYDSISNNSNENYKNKNIQDTKQKSVNHSIEIERGNSANENLDEKNQPNKTTEEGSVGFTLLHDVYIHKKEKIKRKLPDWLANPSVVSVDLKNLSCKVDSITELDKIFVDILKQNNISHFFPVQSQIIPWILKHMSRPYTYWPNDICVSAPTGSGKTLAFVLPILQILYKRIVPKIRALIVLPVQDLATQVFKVFDTYSKSTDLKILLLSKKRPFEEEQSLLCKKDGTSSYRSLVDIIVTTPGRLVDHLTKTKGLCLSDLTYLVIDEADRIMESIQNDWLYHLNKHINSECSRSYQIPIISYSNMINKKKAPTKLLFSATLSQDPEKLQHLGLFQPKLFTSILPQKNDTDKKIVIDASKFIGKYTTPAELEEFYAICEKTNKPLIIHHLLQSKYWKNILCFVNSSKATYRLAFVLKVLSKKNLKISELSANLSLKKRDLVLNKFSSGKLDMLVCSDALARGIDIPNVHYVISYDVPKFVKTYVHRIGRTGRAGKKGSSLTLLTSKEVTNFKKMIQTAGKNSVKELIIDPEELNQYKEAYEKALKLLKNHLKRKHYESLTKVKAKKKLQVKVNRMKCLK